MKRSRKVLAVLLGLIMTLGMLPAVASADEGTTGVTPEQLVDAVKAADSGDTIVLGEGKFTLYTPENSINEYTKGKDLTFVGQGAAKTEWGIGATIPDPDKFGTEYNGDYSFDGAGTITFKNMTLQSGTVDYLGFIRADNTIVENCTINGKTFYWGYNSAEFLNTVFTYDGDYPIWVYSSNKMTFDGCSFSVKNGRVINVDADNQNGKTVTINFKDCNVTSEAPAKSVLNIHDSLKTCDYVVNFSGNNVVTGLEPNKTTCSKLFQVENTPSSNKGHFAKVTINGATIWEDGEMLGHEVDADDGTKIYTDGYKDNAYDVVTSNWEPTDDRTHYVRTVKKTCQYCGWSDEAAETGYTVTYIDGVDGSIFANKSEIAAEGSKTPEFGEDPVREGYTFKGWKPAVAETVTANAIYSAQWEAVDGAAGTEDGEDGSDSSTKTGDSTNLMVLLALLTASLGGGAAALYRRRA